MADDATPDRSGRHRRSYSAEVRRDLVAQVESGLPASRVAQQSGVPPSTLRRWVRQHRAESESPAVAGVTQERSGPSRAAEPRGDVRAHHGPDELFPWLARFPMSTRMVVVAATWSVSVLVAWAVTPSQAVRVGATVVHLLSLAVGFGAVIMIDWHGLLWLARRRGLAESARLAAAAGPLIWAGWAGLLASGSFLDPDFTSGRTWIKLLLVLAIGLNGAAVSTIAVVLRVLPPSVSPKDVPASLRVRIAASTATSQLGWWAAIVIGFMAAL